MSNKSDTSGSVSVIRFITKKLMMRIFELICPMTLSKHGLNPLYFAVPFSPEMLFCYCAIEVSLLGVTGACTFSFFIYSSLYQFNALVFFPLVVLWGIIPPPKYPF